MVLLGYFPPLYLFYRFIPSSLLTVLRCTVLYFMLYTLYMAPYSMILYVLYIWALILCYILLELVLAFPAGLTRGVLLVSMLLLVLGSLLRSIVTITLLWTQRVLNLCADITLKCQSGIALVLLLLVLSTRFPGTNDSLFHQVLETFRCMNQLSS
jgi:hypothetical protein